VREEHAGITSESIFDITAIAIILALPSCLLPKNASRKRNPVRRLCSFDIYVIIILCTAQEGAVERLITHKNAPRRADVDNEF
jgi:hypothetical protein